MQHPRSVLRLGPAAIGLILTASGLAQAQPNPILPPGHRPLPPSVHALVGAKVVTKPGTVLDPGIIILRDGLIAAVGANPPIPPEARRWDMAGLTIYAGFMDPFLSLARTNRPVSQALMEPADETAAAAASGRIRFFGVPGQERDPGPPGPGSELPAVTPERRAAHGLSPDAKVLEELRELGFTSGNVVPPDGVMRGTSALIALADLDPTEALLKPDVGQHVALISRSPLDETSPRDVYPASLMGAMAVIRQSFHDAQFATRDQNHFHTNPQGRRPPLHHPARTALRPSLERQMPVFLEPGSALMIDRLARVAREFNLIFHFVSSGEEWRRPDLAKASQATFIVPLRFPEAPKMPEDSDWEQLTLDQLRAWDWAPENAALLRQSGLPVAFTTYGLDERKKFRPNLRLAIDRGVSPDDALAGLTVIPARLCGMSERLGTIEPGKLAYLTVVQGETYFHPKARVREVWIDGRVYPSPPERPSPPSQAPTPPAPPDAAPKPESSPPQKKDPDRIRATRTARSPLEGRGPILSPPAVLVRGAAIWTCGPQGTVETADLLVVEGRIQAVGKGLKIPESLSAQALIIDAHGQHLTPGLIDAHSHSMILGQANEATLPSTAMVRVTDVINSETANIHRQLAGGLTVANLLHGSANPIGGQNSVIKLRDGASPEDLLLNGAPPGIKFALGENVKQSNRSDRPGRRFPQTRMGVLTFLANRFAAAQQYLDAQQHQGVAGPPVRRDLELEPLAEILQGKRWIHCHSYRQDEILGFLRLMESLRVQIGTLQHVLEGFKVADEIARHGAGASCFADWWAYKFEVYDAIPHAGSLMHQRGALVSFNSDSSDHARRLNLEAAKAVKYGHTSELDALRFVTLHPARQLRIHDRVGSLEPGKDGDFVLWSHSPLDSRAVCLQTWIDGRKYFDRTLERARIETLTQERDALLAKAKSTVRAGPGPDSPPTQAQQQFLQHSLEHAFDSIDRHCLDHE